MYILCAITFNVLKLFSAGISVFAENLDANGGDSELNYSVCVNNDEESNDKSKPSLIYKDRRCMITQGILQLVNYHITCNV